MNIKQFAGINSVFEKPNGERMSHTELYTKVVNAIGLKTCEQYLPVSIEEIKFALQSDPNLNNIKLEKWDNSGKYLKREFGRIGITSLSMSDLVCTLKQSARMLAEEPEEALKDDTGNVLSV